MKKTTAAMCVVGYGLNAVALTLELFAFSMVSVPLHITGCVVLATAYSLKLYMLLKRS